MFKSFVNKIRTFSYYMGTKDAPRPVLGILIDFLLILIGLFSVLYIWMVYRTKSPMLSLIISLVVTFLFAFALYLRKRTSYKKNRAKMRRYVAREYMEIRLSTLSRQEFEWQLIRALSSIKGLTNIYQRQGYLKAKFNNMPIAIGYHHAPPKGYESYEKVWTFYNSLRSRGYNNLIYISSGYFEDACQNIMDKELDIPLSLLDIDNLLDLMEQADMSPDEDLLDHLVEQKISQNRTQRKYDQKRVSGSYKLKRYMMSSLLFLGASFLFRSYFLFYFILSILFFVLGLISQVLSTDNKEYTSKTPQ